MRSKGILNCLAILAVSGLISLGVWQLQRMWQKEDLLQQFNARTHQAALSLKATLKLTDRNYYVVQMRGHYDPTHQYLLDNKTYQHRVGYQALTPFISTDPRLIVLINRGWLPAGNDRRVLPQLPILLGEQAISGVVSPFVANYVLAKTQEREALTWPKRVQTLDAKRIQADLQHPIAPFIVLLGADQPGGLVRDWQLVSMQPSKHLGYAVQWFALAMTLTIITIMLNLRRKDT
jgi:surfeit locus 1 family protein